MALISKPMSAVRDSVPLAMVTAEDVVRLNLNVKKSTRSRWKQAAAERETTITDLILEAMKKAHGL